MTNDDLQLLRDFRAEMPAPDEETRRRIYAYATTEPKTKLPARRWRLPSVAVAAAVAAAVVAVLLVSPWSGDGGGLVGRALAAIGTGPCCTLLPNSPRRFSGTSRSRCRAGQPIQVTQRQEIWFDQSRDLKKTVTTLNGNRLRPAPRDPAGRLHTSGGPSTPALGSRPTRSKRLRQGSAATRTARTGPSRTRCPSSRRRSISRSPASLTTTSPLSPPARRPRPAPVRSMATR